ncbi:hypothetical protein [Chryseobacterium sp. FH1]|uniref:hypothetical protein n=1 Tax=Chryseobacterium sp. FH1 TaxID=1233951 RepID=UPI0004E3CE1A|nr:hypothetical protein [Chryseobacterium sp. FH1]KFC19373.1 hypothetical protein IO90_08705 [Chryseobacterium sp. FH1]
MISLQQLREALAEIKSQIPQINRIERVGTDDQFVSSLKDHKITDNALLVSVTPSYQSFGNEGFQGYYSYLQFFILNKIDYKKQKAVDEQEKLQPIVLDFVEKLSEYSDGECEIFGEIDFENYKLMPITNIAECCGWEIQLEDKSNSGINGLT